MDPIKTIQKYYRVDSKAYNILITHSAMVKDKALEVARRAPQLNPDLDFIREASMLHDIGIILTNAPDLGCFGDKPYICHGYLGRELLEKEGLPKHALVCERHTGVGISAQEIKLNQLPLPERDMLPQSIEEIIICYADMFFSKSPGKLKIEKTVKEIETVLLKFGQTKVDIFRTWMNQFS